jgi:FkbM family methyltransferase
LGEKVDGKYVEVGAYDGIFVSNTWGLAEKGWYGILVEPIPRLAQLCRENYADKPKVKVIETAVGPPGMGEVSLYLAGTLTTANFDTFTEYSHIDWAVNSLTEKKTSVPCSTLDEILNSQQVAPDFELLVVDVEGYETEVFEGFDLQRFRPKMMIVELTDTHPDLASTSHKDAALSTLILNNGYRIVYKDAINTVFVRNDIWESTH